MCYEAIIPNRFESRHASVIDRTGTLNAVRFVTQNVIAIDLAKQKAITWPNQCLVLPTETSIDVSEGQSIEIEFSYSAGGSIEQLSAAMVVNATTGLPLRRAAA